MQGQAGSDSKLGRPRCRSTQKGRGPNRTSNSHFDLRALPKLLKENSHFFLDGNFSSKQLISLLDGRSEMPAARVKRAHFPINSHLSGKFDAETGSNQTASSTTHSAGFSKSLTQS